MKELSRQLIHLSGILFILLAQFLDKTAASIIFFLIAFTFLIYSLYIRSEEKRLQRYIRLVEKKVRSLAFRFERPGIPFQGAFWFYFSCGLAFLVFPHTIATAATLILVISDSLSTLVGQRLGRRKIVGNKSLEGTIAFLVSALVVGSLFPVNYILGALAATLGELLPDTRVLQGLKNRGLVDDNLLIPIFAGIVFMLV